MPSTYSPLRYPGGKTKFYAYVKELLENNGLIGETYIEPFAGGAGLALKLLLKNDVSRIVINDLDPAIYSFWYSVLNEAPEFCDRIANIELTLEEWKRQRAIYLLQDTTRPLELGFAICPLVADLYRSYRSSYLDVTYSIQSSKKAQEYIFFSDNLILPENIKLRENQQIM